MGKRAVAKNVPPRSQECAYGKVTYHQGPAIKRPSGGKAMSQPQAKGRKSGARG